MKLQKVVQMYTDLIHKTTANFVTLKAMFSLTKTKSKKKKRQMKKPKFHFYFPIIMNTMLLKSNIRHI